MPCFHPLHGYRSQTTTASGKRQLVFDKKRGYVDLPVTVPCGQCIGCRLERARQWAVRCLHEAELHERKCFVTLTYDDEHLPYGQTLVKSHFQNFMKRLRKQAGFPIRYFHCGEYGGNTDRPHYHALLYGIDFHDAKLHSQNAQGDKLYKSETLNKIWGHGFCLIGQINYQTAGYTSRYILKKVTGDRAREHYTYLVPETGEIIHRQPEYISMSLKPGIGYDWYKKFKSDVFPSDFVVSQGRKGIPPKYYGRLLEGENPSLLAQLKARRIRRAAKHKADNTPERLATRETVKRSQISTLKRNSV